MRLDGRTLRRRAESRCLAYAGGAEVGSVDHYASLPSEVSKALSPMLSSAIILWLHAVEI